MRKLTQKLALGVSTVLLCITAIDASAFCSAVYRSYNLDQRNCHYYYMDGCGNKVYTGARYSDARFVGLPLHKDCCSGHWYYMDAWGNRIYVSKVCNSCK